MCFNGSIQASYCFTHTIVPMYLVRTNLHTVHLYTCPECNNSARNIHCTCSLKFSPFSSLLISFGMSLDHCSPFPNLYPIVDCSVLFILLCLQSAAYPASSIPLTLSVLSPLITCVCPLPGISLPLSQKIWLLDRLLSNPPTSFVSSCACGLLSYHFFSVFCCLFSLSWFIGMWLVFSSIRLI